MMTSPAAYVAELTPMNTYEVFSTHLYHRLKAKAMIDTPCKEA